MARKIRVEYSGAVYHVLNRGDRREPIFKDDLDRHRFLETLGQACASARTSWAVHAVERRGWRSGQRTKRRKGDVQKVGIARRLREETTMTLGWIAANGVNPQMGSTHNHYHLVMETPNANLVAGMAWLQSTYTIRLNHRHKQVGHVFSGRYKSQLIEGCGNGYLRTACDYVHLNPVRAKLLKPKDRLRAYPWSSFGYYLCALAHRPNWMRVDRLLGEHGIGQAG